MTVSRKRQRPQQFLLTKAIALLALHPTTVFAGDPLHRLPDEEHEEDGMVRATSLTDVWLCMGFALGWTVWMVASTRNENNYRTLQTADASLDKYVRDGIVVPGNVLDAQMMESGGGVPVYHAIIDYKVQNPENGEILQIRKTMETNDLLPIGFANVEMVVLPDDPHSGILREELREMERQEERKLKESDPKIKFVPLGVGGVLVVASVLGALHAAKSLPANRQVIGWVIAAVGCLLLWPLANGCYNVSQRFSTQFLTNPMHNSSCVVLTTPNRATDSNESVVASITSPKDKRLLRIQNPKHFKTGVAIANRLHSCTSAEACSYYIRMPRDSSDVSSMSSTSTHSNKGSVEMTNRKDNATA